MHVFYMSILLFLCMFLVSYYNGVLFIFVIIYSTHNNYCVRIFLIFCNYIFQLHYIIIILYYRIVFILFYLVVNIILYFNKISQC